MSNYASLRGGHKADEAISLTLTDTHCHLDFPDFDADREDVLRRAKEAGVSHIINVASSEKGSRASVELARKYDMVYATVGVHPHDAKDVTEEVLSGLLDLARANKKVVAVGEIGLDYFKDLSPREKQRAVFERLLSLAEELQLPVIIHTREAHKEALEILRKRKLRGVVHCFSGDETTLKDFLGMGFYVSYTANITFPKAEGLRRLAGLTPPERLLLETDAPFLTPQEFRGKRNEPAYLKYSAQALAKLHNLSFDDIARITSVNTYQLFGIGEAPEAGELAYPIHDSLYLNITNRCSAECTFCVREFSDFVKGHNLRLAHEPSAQEVIQAIGDVRRYKEVVFCGYGEPFLRLDLVLEVARWLKAQGAYVRIDTNGHGNLIHGRSVVGELRGLIDELCVSLNAHNEEVYNKLCWPQFGPGTFEAVRKFILEAKAVIPRVSITYIDMPGVDIAACRAIARELGVGFRGRAYNVVG